MSYSPKFNLKKTGHQIKKKKSKDVVIIPAYQSPIVLPETNSNDVLHVHQKLYIKGENIRATYNHEHKIFEVQDVIILTHHNKKYQLDEYHFHIPGEHKVNDKIYESEIHYVFVELGQLEERKKKGHTCSNICGNIRPEDNSNILVIGRVLKHAREHEDLSRVQVQLPHSYYEYDGSLTTGEFSPVRWILGDKSIRVNLNDVEVIAKTARPIQPFDNRLVLYSQKEKNKNKKNHNKCLE